MTVIFGEVLTLGLMAFALGMDAFSVGLGMGMYKLRYRQIFKIGVTIGLFHVMMPLLGMMAGRFLTDQFSDIASYIGGGLMIILGSQMLWSSMKKEEESLITPVGMGLIIFALSVSLDSFSVGLTLGIFGAKTALVLTLFGVTAMALTWTGLLLGRKVQSWLGKYSISLGGGILLAFGIKLLL
ncbi:manganese efflux pump family protein [Cytobacillus horneckiae]|uniref:Putative manganese efflux pump MntP n=1 Tax=Cytobacillus horneckiae TaxID=549687 RepID=A0A2N0ZG02_9BACI|nr:manganese efflux pump MntP family protein [Cytobacillus horneckiae]NRG46517.1 manganese efflux pump [Bacillus sp. CRN 9]MBN6885032.1 manganese efflux pump [Cytobacillus horneckiae]MCM3179222.1 manganese efflux pump MntP family protein [Cytobacillus horneckiae]MEC1154444.1 manganese efflux pump MntP family protein [Cytobacillus horneckiae]MED2937779.1 manganese efflux pump MntP family protein [Cytobacillus horneckiae]